MSHLSPCQVPSLCLTDPPPDRVAILLYSKLLQVNPACKRRSELCERNDGQASYYLLLQQIVSEKLHCLEFSRARSMLLLLRGLVLNSRVEGI